MIVRRKARNKLKRVLNCRKGTAEIVGSIMFLLILLFFFTNVYLWHDTATRQMDDVIADKMNSPVSIQIVTMSPSGGVVNVTNNGGVAVALSRLWITTTEVHKPIELERQNIWVSAGETVKINVPGPISSGEPTFFKILTAFGNTAACKYTPP